MYLKLYLTIISIVIVGGKWFHKKTWPQRYVIKIYENFYWY